MREGAWKEEVVADFKAWLAGLDNDVPVASDALNSPPAFALADGPDAIEALLAGPDLRTLYAELASLRQEVYLQNREQVRWRRQAEGDIEAKLALERRATQRACLQPLLEVRDALARGQAAAGVVRRRRWLRPHGIDEVTEGYALALARFDRALLDLGVTQITTKGETFNVRTMVAVHVQQDGAVPDGVVLEQLRSGFVFADGEVLREAQVVVNKLNMNDGGDCP